MGKPLSERLKARISDLFNNSNMSIGSIADTLDVSVDSVKRHKYYKKENSYNKPLGESIIDNDDPYIDTPDTSYDESEEIYSVDQEEHGGSAWILPFLVIGCIILLFVFIFVRAKGLFGRSEDKANLDPLLGGI